MRIFGKSSFVVLLAAGVLAAFAAAGASRATDDALAHCSKSSIEKAHLSKRAKARHRKRAHRRASCRRQRLAAAYSRCPLRTAGSTTGLTVAGCRTIAADSAAAGSSPASLWGSVDCVSASRVGLLGSGGDTHPTGSGGSQGNTSYRNLTVFDGDDFWGERCELGHNERRGGDYGGTFVLYGEGQRRATFMSFRLPANFPLSDVVSPHYQVAMQMKQTQPSANGGGSPMIELDAYRGYWHLLQWSESQQRDIEIWSAPAEAGSWARFAFDVVYSRNPSVGSITLHADLNGDGDAADANETSPRVMGATLKTETDGSSIPSHLRTGMYHSSAYSCSSGCSIDVDNVQVLSPS